MIKELFSLLKEAKELRNKIDNPVKVSVADIHNEFDIAADTALYAAQIIIDKGFDEYRKEMADKMKLAGFVNTPLVKSVDEEQSIITRAIERANIILKFKKKYPKYKFIFTEQVQEICKKYGLIFGTSDAYKGTIPAKNMDEYRLE